MTKKNYVYKNKENIQEIIGWTTPKLHQASECYVAFKAFDPSYGKLRLKENYARTYHGQTKSEGIR